jgi:hypothetical protein
MLAGEVNATAKAKAKEKASVKEAKAKAKDRPQHSLPRPWLRYRGGKLPLPARNLKAKISPASRAGCRWSPASASAPLNSLDPGGGGQRVEVAQCFGTAHVRPKRVGCGWWAGGEGRRMGGS